MTAESSQPTQTTQNVKRQTLGSQQLRIVLLIILAAAVGVVLWLVLRPTHHKKGAHPQRTFIGIGPKLFTAKNLAAESLFINTKFFWAGKQQGYNYEFTRNTKGYLYVRYLPHGVPKGAKGGRFLIVATYPFVGGYHALKKEAKGRETAGPNHSIVFVRPKDRKSVLMAFPKVQDQIEIYAPSAAVALATAQSGQIAPVRKKHQP